MKAEAIYHNYLIGNNSESTTIYPNIPPEIHNNSMIIDMPGNPFLIQDSTILVPSTDYSISTSSFKLSKKSRMFMSVLSSLSNI